MASAHLRYLALRTRLQPLIAAVIQGSISQSVFAEQLLNEIYRALAQFTALAIYRIEGDSLIALATRGPIEHTIIDQQAGIAGAALASQSLIAVADRNQDGRIIPTAQPFAAELAVPLLLPNTPPLVLSALLAEPRAMGYGDRDLFDWIAHTMAQPA